MRSRNITVVTPIPGRPDGRTRYCPNISSKTGLIFDQSGAST
jgi:hypothetical protein